MIGQTLGHYRIVEKIGAGGMGVVYRAHDEQLDRDVALKILPADSLNDETARARLLREARAAAALNHPHICTVHEVAEAEGQTYIAMEFVEGQPLSSRLVEGALPTEQVLRYGLQLADALGHAHERGVLHRDLKSANVVITTEGRAKVLDFGLAKRVSGNELDDATRSQVSLTVPGALVGTLAYMSPEQLRGQPADVRSDIWALGVVLYEMAAGAGPFKGQTGFELSSAILNQAPRRLPSPVPTELRAVIERCLEKEPGRRYQQAGEVRAALEAIQAGAVAPWEAWRYQLARRRWLALAGAAVVLGAVLVGVNAGGLRERLFGGGTTPKLGSLAVLPFENLSGDPDQEYLAEGIHEALITDLAKLSGLRRVTARSSVMRYQKTEKPLSQIARELKVDALITGAVVRSGNRVRITAHLINAATEEHLWSDSYERELRDVLSLQNEIVAAITRKTRLQLTPQEQARLASARPVNPEAYEAYLKGMFYLHKFTPEGFEKGLAYLQQAIEKDPADPLPHAGLALGYCLMGHERFPDAFARAKAAAGRAQELGGALAETQLAFAEIKFYSDWDLAGAEQDLRQALELNPSLAEAHRHYSWYLNVTGRKEEAFAEMKRTQEIDPLTPTYPADLGWQYWLAGRNDDAISEARKSLELNPNFAVALAVVGYGYAAKGMYDEAISAHQRAATADKHWRWPLGRTYALAGRKEEARKLARELQKDPMPINAFGLAGIYAALGEKDEAFRWLETAYQLRFSWMPWITIDHSFAPLRGDPRFQEMVQRVNTPR